MINKKVLQDALADYKKDFLVFGWKEEKFKWEAIKWFQEKWDIDSPDFDNMLAESLEKVDYLITSGNYYAKGMIVMFAQREPEFVRKMFRELYDETRSLEERVSVFRDKAAFALTNFTPEAKNHFQDEKAVSVYLWLKYPDKYYIYKYSEVIAMIECLESDHKIIAGKWNIETAYKLYEEMLEVIKEDKELVDLFQRSLTDDCYPDPSLHTLTFDVGFYISRYYSKKVTEEAFDETDPESITDEWLPTVEDYNPGFSKEQWLAILNNPKVIGPIWGGALAAFFGMGGAATCSQIAKKYGKEPMSISGNCTQLAKRIHKITKCDLYKGSNGKSRYWPILFQGKKAGPKIEGTFLWNLRPELYDALKEFDIMRYEWKVVLEEEQKRQYWWVTANPKNWSFSLIDVGETIEYTLYNDNGNKRRIFQHFLDAREGDLVICYEGHPVKQIVALGRVAKEQDGEVIYIEKTEVLVSPIDYATLHEAPELSQMEYFINPQGTIFEVKEDEYNYIIDLIREDNPVRGATSFKSYSKEDFLKEVFMTEERYNALVAVLQNKLNIILQGAPGVGKTFAAKRLAYSMMGEEDDSRIEFIQFHQNYSYEDFMMGYKPVDEGFELTFGVFYRFCQKAANNPSKEFFFIIDEINRGNMSKIFGELLMLIERDYRGKKATLAYNGMAFSVPENLYIIGMMNTADRSLAMIDYALRRRFSFFELQPGFDSNGFLQYQKSFGNDTFDKLIDKVKDLNQEIIKDNSLGKGFCIGHSYFCERTTITEEWMKSVVDYDIIPMLQEYWFDDEAKLQKWETALHGVFQ